MNRSRKTFKGVSRQVSALALAGMMSFGSLGLGSVYATDIDATKTSSGSTPAYLSITNEVAKELGMGLTVSIPNEINLIYDSDASEFKTSAKVSAKGILGVDEKLKITTDTSVNYKNEDKESVTAAGTIKFGTSGVETYTADQAYESLTTLDERDISATVPKANIKYKGTYKANINFNIEVAQIEYFKYTENDDGTLTITDLTSDGIDKFNNTLMTYPSTLKGKTVTKISAGAPLMMTHGYYDSTSFPDTITEIGNGVFTEASVKADENGEFKFPSNLVTLGSFQGIYAKDNMVTTLNIPASLTTLPNSTKIVSCKYSGICAFSGLTTINYGGTQEQWTALNFTKPDDYNKTITVHCTDGDITL